ncbi:MAG: hypothetical protein NT150_10945 [Bacteroidetes bacterium]|nr:hypothetical protein [Bacteroidota bacterium]
MDKEDILKSYSSIKPKYEKLGSNLTRDIESFLKEEIQINVLSVSSRIKKEDSFNKKIEQGKYTDPLNEIEDFCGIRIICFYLKDIEEIENIISNEFEVISKEDKNEELKENEFGYRSSHLIVKIKSDWLKAPDYRGLENLKAEIQIRTVLMHTWAEISHKLAYKKENQIPKEYRRLFNLISGNLETADYMFDELRKNITKYKEEILQTINANIDISELLKFEMNLDSLQSILDTCFPNRIKDLNDTTVLVEEFNIFNITIEEFIVAYQKVEKHLSLIEEEIFNNFKSPGHKWSQVGAARITMFISHEYYREREKNHQELYEPIKRWSKIIYSPTLT